MTLLDHFAENAGPSEDGGNGFTRIPSHQFTDSLFLWATGDFTRAEVVSMWSLDTVDEVQLDLLAAAYTAQSGNAAKSLWITKLESGLRLYEYGSINAVKLATILGL